jgi:hypothetical protein
MPATEVPSERLSISLKVLVRISAVGVRPVLGFSWLMAKIFCSASSSTCSIGLLWSKPSRITSLPERISWRRRNLSITRRATWSIEAVEVIRSTSSTSRPWPPAFSREPVSASQAHMAVRSVGLPWLCSITAVR